MSHSMTLTNSRSNAGGTKLIIAHTKCTVTRTSQVHSTHQLDLLTAANLIQYCCTWQSAPTLPNTCSASQISLIF
jgi:hypothetical protein